MGQKYRPRPLGQPVFDPRLLYQFPKFQDLLVGQVHIPDRASLTLQFLIGPRGLSQVPKLRSPPRLSRIQTAHQDAIEAEIGKPSTPHADLTG